MIPARIVPVLLGCLLACVSTASADCAWVAWASAVVPGGPDKPPFPIETFTDLSECKRRAPVSAQELTTLLKGTGIVGVTCLPDTVDPRGPKGGSDGRRS
jgi:hypothetical protein